MPRKKYDDVLKRFIADNVAGTTTKELVELVNVKFGVDFTENKMKSYKANHNLKSGTPVGKPVGMPTELYPEQIKKFIEDHYIGVGPKGMVDLLNNQFGTTYTRAQMKSFYSNNKIDSGLDGRFTKGLVPYNKGKKGYCAPGCEKSWFKQGSIPINHRPVGSERVDVDGYTLVKTAEPNVWELKHKLIWEEHNGAIPKGHAIIFGDRNKGNFNPNNLILVSRQQLLILNRKNLIQNDAELTRTALIIASLYQKTSARKVKAR